VSSTIRDESENFRSRDNFTRRPSNYEIDDSIELKKRGGSCSNYLSPLSAFQCKARDHTMEYDIQKGETMTNIAFKFNVPIAELKRVNNMFTDAEFHALNKIKIPVKPSSLLTEILPGDPPSEGGVFDNENGWTLESKVSPAKLILSSLENNNVNDVGKLPNSMNSGSDADSEGLSSPNNTKLVENNRQKRKVKKLFKNVDKDLKCIRNNQSKAKALDNVTQSDINLDNAILPSSTSCADGKTSKGYNCRFACMCTLFLVISSSVLGVMVAILRIDEI